MQPCYLCNRATQPLLNAKGRTIIRCGHCKLTYAQDARFSRRTLREDSKKFVREYMSEASRYREYFNTIIDIIWKYKKPATLLDVGCGIGVFLQAVKDAGLNAVGVDMSKSAVLYARSQGLDARLGKIEELPLKKESFDVITLFQTIEHIEDPIKTLKKIYTLLRKGGILVMTTPNEESLMARLLGKLWFGYRNIEHVYFFNKQSLAALQKKVGFKKITIESENGRALSAPWVLTRLFDYYYNQQSVLKPFIVKSRPYWKYLRGITFKEPSVNLISVGVK